MQQPAIPQNEDDRLRAVRSLSILDTDDEERFDCITREATKALQVPISTISIVDTNREWFKSCIGMPSKEGDRAVSFCGHTIVHGKLFIIEDTLNDKRFADNPQVVNPPHVRFYAGVTLHDRRTHLPVGAFCIKDTKPRKLSMEELNALLQFAEKAETELNNGIPKDDLQIDPVTHDSTEERGILYTWLQRYPRLTGECS